MFEALKAADGRMCGRRTAVAIQRFSRTPLPALLFLMAERAISLLERCGFIQGTTARLIILQRFASWFQVERRAITNWELLFGLIWMVRLQEIRTSISPRMEVNFSANSFQGA